MMILFKALLRIYQALLLFFLVALSGGWGFLVRQSVPDILFGCALKQ